MSASSASKIGKILTRMGKNAGIGAISGYAAANISSSSAEEPAASSTGWKVGAFIGALTGLPPRPTFRILKGAAIGGTKAATTEVKKSGMKVLFRKVRGRIIPIRVKK